MKVPVYEGSTVQTQAQPASFISGGGSSMAGLAKGLQQVSANLFDVAAIEKKKADEKWFLDKRVAVDNLESSNAYGDDENEGFLNLRGEDAPKHLDAYLNDFKEKMSALASDAGSDERRQAFDVMASERMRTVERQFRAHASAQFQNAVDASQEALEKSTLRNIGNYYRDEDRFSQELMVGRQTIMTDAENKGQDPETRKFRLDTFTSQAYGQRVERLAQESPAEAKKFLEENRDLMTANDVAKYEKELKPLTVKQAGMDAALALSSTFNAAGTTADLWTARDKALTEARTQLKGDPDALNIAETQIRQMASEREQGIKIMQAQAVEPIYSSMVQARKAGRIPALSDFDPNEWSNLQSKDPEKAAEILKGIQTEVRVASEHRMALADRKERRDLIDQQKQILANQKRNFSDLWSDPNALQGANLDALVASGGLTPDQGAHLEHRRKSSLQDTLFTEQQELTRIITAGKIKPKTEQYDQVIGYVAQRRASFVAENKRQPKASEVADFAREALYQVDAEWTPFDKPAFKMTLDDVPKKYRSAITQERQKRGLGTSDFEIISTYAQVQRKKGGK